MLPVTALVASVARLVTPFSPADRVSVDASSFDATSPIAAVTTVPASLSPSASGDGRRFHALPAALQTGLFIGLNLGWYEWQIELNKRDFDFARTFSDQWRRLATPAGYRFDDNERYLNVGHAFVGAVYYQTARAHGAGVGTSYLWNIASSTVWETMVEHREVVSVNDQIVTGLGGSPIGESLFRISEVFARGRPGRPSLGNRVLAGVFCPMRVGAWLAGEPSGADDDRGPGEDGRATAWHRFDLSMGLGFGLSPAAAPGTEMAGAPSSVADGSAFARALPALRADFEVVNLPVISPAGGRARTGTEDRLGPDTEHVEHIDVRALSGGEMTRFLVDWSGGASDTQALQVFARSTLWGRFHQRWRDTPDGPRGSQRTIALASAFDLSYDRVTGDLGGRRGADGVLDFMALAHVLGPTIDVSWIRDRFGLRSEWSAYGDFAMVQPLALDPQASGVDLAGAKSTVQKWDYDFGWGVTAAWRLEASYRRFRAGAAAEWNHVDSIEGLDRHQVAYTSPTGVFHPAITDDADFVDDRLKARAFAETPVPFVDALRLAVVGDMVHRRGEYQSAAPTGLPAASASASASDLRLTVALKASL